MAWYKMKRLNRCARSNLNRDIHARRQIQLLKFVRSFCRWLNNINEPLVRALLKGFLRLFVRMRRALHSKALDACWERDRSCDSRARAFHGVGDIARGLVYDAVVIGLQSNANALSSHTKNNCLLMVVSDSFPEWENGTRNIGKGQGGCKSFYKTFAPANCAKIIVTREG